jgi:hypothetical protein
VASNTWLTIDDELAGAIYLCKALVVWVVEDIAQVSQPPQPENDLAKSVQGQKTYQAIFIPLINGIFVYIRAYRWELYLFVLGGL